MLSVCGVSVSGSGSVCGVAELAPPPALFRVGGSVLRKSLYADMELCSVSFIVIYICIILVGV